MALSAHFTQRRDCSIHQKHIFSLGGELKGARSRRGQDPLANAKKINTNMQTIVDNPFPMG
jgi:hypothetical protein